jgi:hypothetical protein
MNMAFSLFQWCCLSALGKFLETMTSPILVNANVQLFTILCLFFLGVLPSKPLLYYLSPTRRHVPEWSLQSFNGSDRDCCMFFLMRCNLTMSLMASGICRKCHQSKPIWNVFTNLLMYECKSLPVLDAWQGRPPGKLNIKYRYPG